ncbi:MAG: hypothetical protein NTX50_22355 [Candidatus Sumerlaeota bacterium]|nr:hypothetical protein [Candidatus Sumerlaeota bacterium]
MPQMPVFLSWILAEIAVVASLFAVFWAVSVFRLRWRYRALCDDLQSHLSYVNSAFDRLTNASRNLHKEIERLFSDPARREGLERLETLRAGLDRQRQSIEELKVAPMTPAFLLREAIPALDRAITAYEKNLSMLLRQWDDAITSAAPPPVAPAELARLEETEARLASLRSEHEALVKMHESLILERRQAEARNTELQDALAKTGDQERQRAEAQAQAQAEALEQLKEKLKAEAMAEATAAKAEFHEQLGKANEQIASLEVRLREAETSQAAFKELRDKIALLEAQLSEAQSSQLASKQLEKKNASLEAQLSEAQSSQLASKHLENKIASLEAQLSEAEARQLDSERLRENAASLEMQLHQLRQDLQEKSEVPAEKESHTADEKEDRQMREEITALRFDLDEARKQAETSNKQLEETKRKMDELAMEVEISRATADDINAALIKTKEDLQNAEAEKARLLQKLKDSTP